MEMVGNDESGSDEDTYIFLHLVGRLLGGKGGTEGKSMSVSFLGERGEGKGGVIRLDRQVEVLDRYLLLPADNTNTWK